MEDMYDMKLNQIIYVSLPHIVVEIVRVPGGWIYRGTQWSTSVFVPYNDEFKEVRRG